MPDFIQYFLFIGFAGNLVVGVWVGRDDDRPLGRKISGGTAAAQIWRGFMAPAIGVDGRRGPALPREFKVPERPRTPTRDRQSPLPGDWSESTKDLRELFEKLDEMFGQ